MNIDTLAREAFIARTLTGYEPTGTPPDHVMDAGCARDENRNLEDEPTGFFFVVFGDDFTTITTAPMAGIDRAGGIRTLGESNVFSPGSGAVERTRSAVLLARHQLLRALTAFRTQLPRDTYETIRRRVQMIVDPEEWEESDKLPDADSFDLMLRFLTSNRRLQAPRVFLSPRGLFTASWRAARDQLTTLEFCPDGTIRWLVFSPPLPGEQAKQRGTGDCSVKNLLSYIAPFNVLDWMRRAGE